MMPLTYENNQWTRKVPLPGVKLAYETESGRLFAIHDDGRVMLDEFRLNDDASLALHDYDDPGQFRGYAVPHSGEWKCVTESNGYVTAAWMAEHPDAHLGTPIHIAVFHPNKHIVHYPLGFAGMVLDHTANRDIDNHCLPQLFIRESDKRVVYLSGGHNTTLYAGVSSSPHAGYGFQCLYPVGPLSRYTNNGHTYPAARLVGDTLHIVSRFLDGDYSLVHFTVDTRSMLTGEVTVLDKAPDGHKYAIWYQQPRVEGNKLIIDTRRRYRPKDQPDTYLSEPEPKTFEVEI